LKNLPILVELLLQSLDFIKLLELLGQIILASLLLKLSELLELSHELLLAQLILLCFLLSQLIAICEELKPFLQALAHA